MNNRQMWKTNNNQRSIKQNKIKRWDTTKCNLRKLYNIKTAIINHPMLEEVQDMQTYNAQVKSIIVAYHIHDHFDME